MTMARRLLLALGAALVFGLFNWSIAQKEALLRDGQVVRLALAPVDPRAFLTGDYMALNYAIAAEAARLMTREAGGRREQDGFVIAKVDERRVATLLRVQQRAAPVAPGEVAMAVRLRGGRGRIGTDAYYFEEGSGKRFEAAKFGEFRVDGAGQMLLVGLLDGSLDPLR